MCHFVHLKAYGFGWINNLFTQTHRLLGDEKSQLPATLESLNARVLSHTYLNDSECTKGLNGIDVSAKWKSSPCLIANIGGFRYAMICYWRTSIYLGLKRSQNGSSSINENGGPTSPSGGMHCFTKPLGPVELSYIVMD